MYQVTETNFYREVGLPLFLIHDNFLKTRCKMGREKDLDPRAAVSIQYRRVIDTQRQTDTRRYLISALAERRADKAEIPRKQFPRSILVTSSRGCR